MTMTMKKKKKKKKRRRRMRRRMTKKVLMASLQTLQLSWRVGVALHKRSFEKP